jgi:cell division protein FtsL
MQRLILHIAVATQISMLRCLEAARDQRGDVAEKVVIVGIFVALAIAAGAIIYNKVIAASNAINLGS